MDAVLLDLNLPHSQGIATELRKSAATVEVAGNRRETVTNVDELVQTGQVYDLILMDNDMPILNGFQARARLFETGYQRPVMAPATRSSQEERKKCLASGCNDLVSKPFQRAKLIESVKNWCSASDPDPQS